MKVHLVLLLLFFSCSNSENMHHHKKECIHWRVSHRPDGTLQDSMSYNFDSTICHGVEKIFESNGKLGAICACSYGKRQGPTLLFYDNRAIKQLIYFDNDISQEYLIVFYQNGNVKEVDTIVNGEKFGNAWQYDSIGNVIQKGHSKQLNKINLNLKVKEYIKYYESF